MKVKNETDFWSGVMFIICGLFFLLGAQNYELGFARRMGPAFFPTILGGILILLGMIIGLQGLAVGGKEGKLDKFYIGPIGWVIASVIAFALLLKPAGLLLSISVLVVLSMFGSHEFNWKEAGVVSCVMAIIVWVVFIYGLGLTIPVLPNFLTQ